MLRRAIAAAGAAAIVWTAAPSIAAQSRQDMTPEEPGAYVAVAGAIEVYEARASELALEKASRPEVRAYARTMLDEHRRSTARLSETARAAGLEALLPPAMMPVHWDMLRRLERSGGSRFDRAYVDQEIEAHEAEVELHRNYAANGHGERLKAYAEAALPSATRHLGQARALED